MNLCGEAVSLLVRKFGVSLADLLIIHDDLDLPLGKLRIRQGGGSGGHRGVQSIITSLGNEDFSRIRVGIEHPEEGVDTISYVLASFTPAERQVIKELIPQVSAAIHCLLTEGIDAAMNRYN
jgi:PTH1 family peptidyl-tRNA hydrolase